MTTYADSGEPPTKRQSIDFDLCLRCQGEQWVKVKNKIRELEAAVTCPKPDSYQKFLDNVDLRAGYVNQDFVQLNQRLHGLTADILEQTHAVWHRTCYSEVTHKVHTERNRKRFERALSAKDSNTLSCRKEKGRPTSSRTFPVCDNCTVVQR